MARTSLAAIRPGVASHRQRGPEGVVGQQRSVPYRGQETVLDLLQRVGGLTPGAEPDDVYVVRPHIGDNKRAEVFHVHLRAIVMKQDHKTNIRLLPFDQVYVGETRQARVEKAIPPWMQPIYRAFWNTRDQESAIKEPRTK